jgi:hypothetical protein
VKDFIKINGVSLSKVMFGRKVFITDIKIETSEKKKVLVDVPFSNGSIDLSYTFANENFFKDVSLSFTVTVFARNDVSRTEANKIADTIKDIIIPISGTMEIETSNYIGRRYICTHVSTTSEHLLLDDLMNVTFSFLAKPYALEKVGGKGYCDFFDDMFMGDCLSTAYSVEPAIKNEKYTINFKHPNSRTSDLLIETSAAVVVVNTKEFSVLDGKVVIPKSQLTISNNAIYVLTNTEYLYISYERLVYF